VLAADLAELSATVANLAAQKAEKQARPHRSIRTRTPTVTIEAASMSMALSSG
jgi:hypothetical protein